MVVAAFRCCRISNADCSRYLREGLGGLLGVPFGGFANLLVNPLSCWCFGSSFPWANLLADGDLWRHSVPAPLPVHFGLELIVKAVTGTPREIRAGQRRGSLSQISAKAISEKPSQDSGMSNAICSRGLRKRDCCFFFVLGDCFRNVFRKRCPRLSGCCFAVGLPLLPLLLHLGHFGLELRQANGADRFRQYWRKRSRKRPRRARA